MLKSKKIALVAGVTFLASTMMSTVTFAGELLKMNTFDGTKGLPWHTCETGTGKVSFDITGGKYVVKILNSGKEQYDCQLRYRGLKLEAGHTYTIKFTVEADKDCTVYCKIGDMGSPYGEYWNNKWTGYKLTAGVAKTVTETFTMDKTVNACEYTFHIGGDGTGQYKASQVPTGTTLKFDDLYLSDPQYTPPVEPPPPADMKVRVNQLGYYPNMAKKATLITDSNSPTEWKLKDSSGKVVASGTTTPFGADEASGDKVQKIDFSSYTGTGTGFTLEAGGESSYPFDINNDIYTQMKADALQYFYHNRSGIEIKMPYAGREDLTRKAGHPNDSATTKDGTVVDCTGGWYDAGDHGKYVVNGGISAWTMMNQYELAKIKGYDSIANFKMNIPENTDSIPDLLNESRWEMDWILKMQVKSGSKKGMAYHKMHDEKWTALGLAPSDDEEKRVVRDPSTAATLNLAATAAQAARLWEKYDSTFASKCLTAAKEAWTAALANPNIIAPLEKVGGGPYNDDYIKDDFYWAAAELYTTTGDDTYLNYIKSSPHYLEVPTKLTAGETGPWDWAYTSGLGTMSLLINDKVPASDKTTVLNNLKAAGDTFLKNQSTEGYGTSLKPYEMTVYSGTDQAGTPSQIVGYPWGSNSFVANTAMLFTYAYLYTNDVKYLNGATENMDYLMGRNALQQCYVSGYGEIPVEWPHHRFWAYQTDSSKFPKAPAGCLVGGPNSGLEDPWVRGDGFRPGNVPAAKAYLDNIEAWSANEITINWNTPLAWVTAYLSELAPKADGGGVIIVPGNAGDVDGNGKVNAIDLLKLKQYILGLLEDSDIVKANADMDGNGKVNSTDLLKLKMELLNS